MSVRPGLEELERRRVFSVSWTNPNGGDWDTASNWSGDAVPNSTDDVTISIAVSGPITHDSSASDSVASLMSSDPITLAGGILSIGSTAALSAPLTLSGGTISGGTIDLTNGATVVGTSSGGTLSAITLNGNLDLTATSSDVSITNGLTLNGTATLSNGSGTYAALLFSGTQTLGGSGSVLFNNGTVLANDNYPYTGMFLTSSNTSLTIGPNITVHGGEAEIGRSDSTAWTSATNVSLVLQGTIDADSAGETIYVDGTNWTNSGTLQTDGGSLVLEGSWTSTTAAALTVNAGTLELGGTWSTTSTVTVNGGTLSVAGAGTWGTLAPVVAASGATMSFDGGSLALSSPITLSGAGLFRLNGASLTGGTINLTNGATLVGTTSGGTLSAITLNGNLDLTATSSDVSITNGLTLNGTATLSNGSGTYAALLFSGTQTLGGSGSVLFNNGTVLANDNYPYTGMFLTSSNTSLTIGPNITVHGGEAEIGRSDSTAWTSATNVSLVLQGTIDADSAGETIYVDGTNWTNSGTLQTDGGSLVLEGSWTSTTAAALTVNAGTLELGGTWSTTSTVTVNGGTLSVAGAGTWGTLAPVVAASGATMSFDGGSLALSSPITLSGAGLFRLNGASLTGGTINLTNGATLVGTTSGGTLSAITLNGNLDLTATSSDVSITNGLTLNGTATLSNGSGTYAALLFSGTQTLGGSGSVLFNNGTVLANDNYPYTGMFLTSSNTSLTIGPNITVHGGEAEIGRSDSTAWTSATNVSLVLQGTIDADSAGETIYVDGTNWTNSGTLQTDGGSLVLEGSWTSTTAAALTVNAGTLELGGTWSTTSTVTVNGGTLSVAGAGTWGTLAPVVAASGATMSFDGGSLALSSPITLSGAGLFRLNGASLTGGTINLTNGATLVGTTSGGTLSAITLNGNLDLTATSSDVSITNGLTLNGTATLSNGSGTYAALLFSGTQTLGGSGSVLFNNGTVLANDNYPYTGMFLTSSNTSLTIGPNITVHGGEAEIGRSDSTAWTSATNVSLVLQGTIDADSAGETIYVDGTNWTNSGTLEAQNGGVLNVVSTPSNLSSGTLTGGTWSVGANSTLSLAGGSITANAATIILGGTGATFPTLADLAVDSMGSNLELAGGASLTTAGNLDNSGTIDLASGTLDVAGSFSQEPTGSFDVAIGGLTPGSQFGQLNVTGEASLGGALGVSLTNGYAPVLGDSYQVMTFGSVTGAFATGTGLSIGGGLGFSPTIGATSLNLLVGASGSYNVTTTADSGPGSLRSAIDAADASTGGFTINFSIATGPQTIILLSALPSITSQVTIDGTSQPGYAGAPLIDLDGSSAGAGTTGLDFESGSGGSVVRTLVIDNFSQYGIELASAGNTVESCYVGTNAAGTAAGSRPMNDGVIALAANNTIGGAAAGAGNVISGNTQYGIQITGEASAGNAVAGNFIGTDQSGSGAVGNYAGVEIDSGASGNLIGTNGEGVNAALERNIISGNTYAGVWVTGAGTDNNIIAGDYVGTNPSGTQANANTGFGVLITYGASGNTIGGETAAKGCLISGNLYAGIDIYSSGTDDNVVSGSLIGTDVTGEAALPNANGVQIPAGAANNTIGGTASAPQRHLRKQQLRCGHQPRILKQHARRQLRRHRRERYQRPQKRRRRHRCLRPGQCDRRSRSRQRHFGKRASGHFCAIRHGHDRAGKQDRNHGRWTTCAAGRLLQWHPSV